MKSLAQFISESLDSGIIRDKAFKFTALSKVLDRMSVPTTRSVRVQAQESIKKFLGKGPYYVVRSDMKFTKDVFKEIMDKAAVGSHGIVDIVSINKLYKDQMDEYGNASPEVRKMRIKKALEVNKTLKEKGLTNDLDTLLKRMEDLVKEDPIKLDHSYTLGNSKGDLERNVNFFPSACIIDDKLVPVLQAYNESMYAKDKTFVLVFSESTLKNGINDTTDK